MGHRTNPNSVLSTIYAKYELYTNTNYTNNEEHIQVYLGDVSYHIVNVILTNRDFFHSSNQLGKDLIQLKFEVSDIENNHCL